LFSCASTRPPRLTGVAEVRLERNLLLLEVPAAIDGRAYKLIVDTGASVTSLTEKTAKDLAVLRDGRTTINGGQDAATGTIARLTLAGLELRDLRVAVVSLPSADKMTLGYAGILGLDVLGRYDTVIDLTRFTLTLMHAGAAARVKTDALAMVPMRVSRDGQVVIDVTIAGRTVPAVVDTGATHSIMAPATLPGRDADRVTEEVRAGDVDFGMRTFIVGTHPAFARLGFAGRPVLLLGVDALRGRQLVLAYRDRRLYLSRR
jgi:predicted aspartyl protease